MQQQALVVGGSSTIGTAVAATLADRGLSPVLWGLDPGRLTSAVAAVGGPARARRVDLRDRAAIRAGVDELSGGPPLRCVVWAAGLFDWSDPTRASPDGWHTVIEVNLQAATYLSALVSPLLVENAPSSLVFVGSTAAHQAFAHNAAYVASKHGLRGLAQALWADLRERQVKVSLVSPGLVAAGSGMEHPAAATGSSRWLQPSDVAAAVDFVVGFSAAGCPVEVRLEGHIQP